MMRKVVEGRDVPDERTSRSDRLWDGPRLLTKESVDLVRGHGGAHGLVS